ncbi:MAG: ABC transporter substrate-binding protein, partial [Betaproteobacteria bacterium]|nr:ABC transporter substrate-binding protein [Betaproteobacteria bacterium]
TVLVLLALGAAPLVAEAQPARVFRVGVVLQGGDAYYAAIDGLRDGLKALGLEDGKQVVLHVRDAKGDLKSAKTAAKSLENEKVDVIYAVATSVTIAAKRGTNRVPIVFYAGSDPIAAGLVENLRKPGGRLTGIHGQSGIATGKRLELLKVLVPKLRRVMVFYGPGNIVAEQSMKSARDAAQQFKVGLVERPVASVEKLQASLRELRPSPADAIFFVNDAMILSQAELIVETARALKLPTMFTHREAVAHGALASYGDSYHMIGRLSAKYVQQILKGANPGDLPVEQLDRRYLVVNLKTAKALGLTIPQSVLVRTDEIIR